MRQFTEAELARFNGQRGTRALIACQGKVYDVSGSFLWQNGRHQARHRAGRDLTASLDQAPHGADVLARCPVVGALKLDRDGCEDPRPESVPG